MQHGAPDPATLTAWLQDTVDVGRALIDDLTDEQLATGREALDSPMLWRLGRVAWFLERWNLRSTGQPGLLERADALYDITSASERAPWSLSLPSRAATLEYGERVRQRLLERIQDHDLTGREIWFVMLGVFHADMHNEALLAARQALGHPEPALLRRAPAPKPAGTNPADAVDVDLPFGSFELGADHKGFFVFDNEKWAHEVNVHAFSMSRTAVSQGEYLEFVEDEGYTRPELWSPEGRRWLKESTAQAPLYWKREAPGTWLRRRFDVWEPLSERHAMVHVNWFEAEAWCNWAGRRLPTEAEWEFAASTSPRGGTKRYLPWGEDAPTTERANLGMRHNDTIDVDALPAGDSAWGVRQLIGNVWEWTADDFGPYPGFSPEPDREHSSPAFDTTRVLRGGAWPTPARMMRNTLRGFENPRRRDAWCGFRTCALAS